MFKKILILLFIFLLFVLLFFLFLNPDDKEELDEKIEIMVTIPPYAEFVEKIGGEMVRVSIMVPPSANPHTYELIPSKLKDLSRADMYIQVGSGIEFELSWMSKIREINKKMIVVDSSKGVDIIANNPHIWLSLKNSKIIIENIYEKLVKKNPENKNYYLQNKNNYLSDLIELDKKIKEILLEKELKEVIVYHPFLEYFLRDYGFIQLSIEEEGKEPSPQIIANIIKEAKEKGIKNIFASPEVNSKNAEVLANEIGGQIIFVSPLAKDYYNNMNKILNIFKNL